MQRTIDPHGMRNYVGASLYLDCIVRAWPNCVEESSFAFRLCGVEVALGSR
jgi:hypothetical protein